MQGQNIDLLVVMSKLEYLSKKIDYIAEQINEIYCSKYNKYSNYDETIDIDDEIPMLTEEQAHQIIDLLWNSERYGVNDDGSARSKQ